MNTPLVSIMLRGSYLKIQNESLYLSDAITAVSNGYKKNARKKLFYKSVR